MQYKFTRVGVFFFWYINDLSLCHRKPGQLSLSLPMHRMHQSWVDFHFKLRKVLIFWQNSKISFRVTFCQLMPKNHTALPKKHFLKISTISNNPNICLQTASKIGKKMRHRFLEKNTVFSSEISLQFQCNICPFICLTSHKIPKKILNFWANLVPLCPKTGKSFFSEKSGSIHLWIPNST